MTTQIVSAGTTSTNLTVSSGDTLLVLSGGTTSYTTVLTGGTVRLSSGASAEQFTVSSGAVVSGAGRAGGVSYDFGLVTGVEVSGVL
jgi:autotransporter passenger strand-loop-strand repeat protein